MLGAMAAHARGAVELAAGDARAALARRGAPRRCGSSSRRRTRRRARATLVGLACRALGDDDTAALELEAARGVFAELGAAPDSRASRRYRSRRRRAPTA